LSGLLLPPQVAGDSRVLGTHNEPGDRKVQSTGGGGRAIRVRLREGFGLFAQ
jgi:hypothetical protein